MERKQHMQSIQGEKGLLFEKVIAGLCNQGMKDVRDNGQVRAKHCSPGKCFDFFVINLIGKDNKFDFSLYVFVGNKNPPFKSEWKV